MYRGYNFHHLVHGHSDRRVSAIWRRIPIVALKIPFESGTDPDQLPNFQLNLLPSLHNLLLASLEAIPFEDRDE